MSVYFIRAKTLGMVKIGHSVSPKDRLRELISASPPLGLVLSATIKGSARKEKQLHIKYSKYRAGGEWFYDKGALSKFIDALPRFMPPKNKLYRGKKRHSLRIPKFLQIALKAEIAEKLKNESRNKMDIYPPTMTAIITRGIELALKERQAGRAAK